MARRRQGSKKLRHQLDNFKIEAGGPPEQKTVWEYRFDKAFKVAPKWCSVPMRSKSHSFRRSVIEYRPGDEHHLWQYMYDADNEKLWFRFNSEHDHDPFAG